MNADSGNDDEWLARMARGDEEALVLLMRKYYVHLAQFAHSLLDRHDLAQEAVSNVFISLWRRRETLSIRTGVRHYLFGAVVKQASSLLASDVIRPELVPLDNVPAHQLAQPAQSDDGVLYREFQAEIEALLASMPPQRQQVFRMSRIENMRYKEIGESLGISEFTVRSHIAKAMRTLEEALPGIRSRLKGDSRTG
ncbi:sigma-70 family RNA polymerase sigma factor [Termitidicoccus mucosus]|uniref:RNA polymerase sigma factor 70 region 4 type 2 domain-containing protein n=1 Tax=Termitidicoccus mucosus TaxID=1184151 RepID=A0A178ILY6_9BACT|nr:hypothetical protein AW736_09915 [Opitutaceae bacterium TSB47]